MIKHGPQFNVDYNVSTGMIISQPTYDRGEASEMARTGSSMGSIWTPQMELQFSQAEAAQANKNPYRDTLSVKITSVLGVDAEPKTIYLFNQQNLANVTDNGSGAGSIIYNWQDGYGGFIINETLNDARFGAGAVCFGMSLKMMNVSDNVGAISALDNSKANWITRDWFGNAEPNNFDMAAYQSRQDYRENIIVIPCMQNIKKWNQFAFIQPVEETKTYETTAVFYFNKLKFLNFWNKFQ